jgi:hypothetical protein
LARLLELFEYSVEIIYSSQLEITSILDALSFPWRHSAGILLYSPNVLEARVTGKGRGSS